MILAINNHKTLADLQEKFSECYPHLKLEFYPHAHHNNGTSAQQKRLNGAQTVSDVSHKDVNGLMDIKSWYQVGHVEQQFHHQFGLNVQIFRNQNGMWVQPRENESLVTNTQSAALSQPQPSTSATEEEEEPIY